jgi:hypothetical protein
MSGPLPTTMLQVPLYRAAHGRTGDKGDRANISVIAYHPALYPLLEAQVTETAVAARFAHRSPGSVKRYLLPKLHAMNFVLDGVLDGGVNSALNLDAHGKALAFGLLGMPIEVPSHLIQWLVEDPSAVPHTKNPEEIPTCDVPPAFDQERYLR